VPDVEINSGLSLSEGVGKQMVRIRLRRMGSKKQPSYRIVVTNGTSPRDGRFIEKIGFYNPRTQPETVEVDESRALYWLSVGAQPSEAVQRRLGRIGTIGRYERLRNGEAIEALAAEVETAGRPVIDRRTRRDDVKPVSKKKASARAEAAAAPAPVAVAEEPPAEEQAAEPAGE
jgi:small subunit ribosomal protein S16